MAEGQDFDAAEFADQLSAMTDEELFALMQKLEDESENTPSKDRDSSEVFVRIAMVEITIEERFPGQLLVPYKDWQQRRIDI
ncbi:MULTISPECIES: hypothetical protein [Agrobacterium]|uniref:Uncharacterized protein n=2 Tax=Agrobacterium tumefaciens complex TaxID=1183400 RepID=A0AAE6EIS4_AGRTU|nr:MULTISPECIES: hypothetical protein [Agrobacterium]ASK40665.1 hypothetical protein [Agrobacterium genomosp. 6]ASK41429.1 hypothetical protein [Agrobacterium genomosp. 6]QCL77528.1 hypothetical protein CFBP5499_29190 [Agrobacterium tumefaciens]QCL83016.1 hypothetical protein CFBP5877_28355 [Agrobacterium tumefaciens]CUX71502.1 conserved hypothetical protein [Agrobacterium sp. NCPPB 925]